MKKTSFISILLCALLTVCSGCMSTRLNITNTVPLIQLEPEDLEITEQKEAKIISTKVFGIDWKRAFKSHSAEMRGSVYSNIMTLDKSEDYAVYDLLKNNEGYDMVLYPKFDKVVRKPVLGLGFLYKVTEVKVTARMAKLKSNQ